MVQSILVVPGTGKQGRAVAQEFLKLGTSVHCLVRNEASAPALELQSDGAKIHTGDLGDIPSIERVLQNVDTVFLSLPAHPTSEIQFATNVVSAAKNTGVKHFIYTSVARTGEHESIPGWSEDYPMAWYWKTKQAVEDLLRAAHFEYLTILRPAFFMQNFCSPVVEFMFPGLAESHTLSVPFDADTKFDLIDTRDIARFAAAAAKDPAAYNGKAIPLAGDNMTAQEIVDVLSDVSGSKIAVNLIDKQGSKERIENGDIVMVSLEFQREFGYGVSLEEVKKFGIPLTPFSGALTKQDLGWSE